MATFDWDPKYDLGVEDMNQQHKQLLKLMAKLQSQNEKKAGRDAITQTLTELGSWTTRHFKEEEAYMERMKYPDLKSHSLIHKNLLEKFAEHQSSFQKSGKAELPASFFSFLSLWLSSHILGIDMKYGHHARGVKQAS